MSSFFKSKTIWFNMLLAAGGGVLPYLAGVDWTQYVSPTLAPLVVAGIGIGLRYVTKEPMSGK